MSRLAVALALLGAACHAGAPTGPRVPLPSGPPPSVACTGDPDDCTYQATGLPAITADGRAVVIAIDTPAGDGGGAPGFRVVELAVGKDHPTHELVIEEPPREARLPAAKRDSRLRQLNIYLAHRGLTPLAAHPCEGPDPESSDVIDCRSLMRAGQTGAAEVGPLHVEFIEPHLRITRAGAAVLDLDVPGWSAPPRKSEFGDGCGNPAYLQTVWADLARGVLVFAVGYDGSDSCWEPGDTYHALALPR